MQTMQLDQETAADLRTLAILTGRSELELLREAVAMYLQELRDAGAADEVLLVRLGHRLDV